MASPPLLRSSSFRPPSGANGAIDLREVWFSLMRKRWSTLAVVPAHAGGDAVATARSLADLGNQFRTGLVSFISADRLDLGGAAQIVERILLAAAPDPGGPRGTGGTPQLVVALPPPIDDPMAIPVVMAVDAVLLIVEQGVSRLEDVRHTLEIVGRDRVLGTLLIKSGH